MDTYTNIGLFVKPDGCASYVTQSTGSDVVPLFGLRGSAGTGWLTLATTLDMAPAGDALNIFTNIELVAQKLTNKTPPEPTRVHRGQRCYGGDAAHWQVLRHLSPYGSRWTVRHVDGLRIPLQVYGNVEQLDVDLRYVPADMVIEWSNLDFTLDEVDMLEY